MKNQKELDMAIKLINAMNGHFTPEEYTDEYPNRLKHAIDKKINGKEIKSVKKKSKKSISDLMTALEKSLKENEKK